MNQQKKNLVFSKVLIFVFGAAIVFLDALCIHLGVSEESAMRAIFLRTAGEERLFQLIVCTYLCSIPGFILLHRMFQLLTNLEKGNVFTCENTTLMTAVSRCCYYAGGICLVFVLQGIIPLLAVTVAAWFVALIVQIVRDTFRQAIAMKNELDYTV